MVGGYTTAVNTDRTDRQAGESSPLTKADFSDTASALPMSRCTGVPYPYCLTANGRGVRSSADLECGRR